MLGGAPSGNRCAGIYRRERRASRTTAAYLPAARAQLGMEEKKRSHWRETP